MTLNVPNEILNDTPADAVPINTNYKQIEQYTNTQLVNRSGSLAMTGQLTLVGDPVQINHAARKGYVDAVLPIGIMLPWLGSSAPAGHWAMANGASLQKSQYPVLFNVLQYRYGGSGGSFKLPDMGGLVPIGQKNDDPYYKVVGNYGGSTKVPVPEHVHSMTHDHPAARTGMEAAHTHDHPHTHNIEHEHTGKYNSYATPAAGGTWLSTRAADGGSLAGMTADQTETVSEYPNDDKTQPGTSHDHAFDVANFTGDTGAYKLEVTDPDGNKTTTDFYAPFVVINYIVRIQ